MEIRVRSKALTYVIPAGGIAIALTLIALFIFPAAINIIISVFIALLLLLLIYNINLVSKQNIAKEDKKLLLRDVFYKEHLFEIKNIQKLEVHTNFICRLYDIKIIKLTESGTNYQLYMVKVKPEELQKIVQG
ncbi:MAG: hypothetical protein JNL72_01875 [Flavipsychrobacter sp.]|nr:hypothetical protein [Flavipsychrobacter sp.]